MPAGADDLARFQAIERKQKEMVAACEKAEHHRCQVAAFDGGLRYVLVDSLEFPDVRLVYAPPGGCRRLRRRDRQLELAPPRRRLRPAARLCRTRRPAGAEGEPTSPYRPRHFFPVSPRGVEPDSFVMVAGYPGLTFRSYTEAEMRERAELFYPRRAELYRVLDRPDGGRLEDG